MTKKNLIPKYPYLGYSPNIIEYFGIIGYQEEFIENLIKETPRDTNPYSPTILNSVISNIDYGTTDNNLMLSQIYPDNPPIIKADYYNIMPSPTNIIYSFCFDSQDGKKKLFYTCYAYKFHETYKNPLNNDIYYVPKAFSVISQYAFFNTFHYICQNLVKIINSKNKNSLPMELLIYSLLNYLPTPMNYAINLSVFDSLTKTDQLKLEQLSGYPYIDFDLGEIFNLLPSNIILEIYLITFLEQKILFFSQNLEILNIIMYSMFSLNYPCNDSIYFWHIVSLSPKNFTDDNKFVGKLQNSLLGVNATYDDNLDTSSFGPYYFIMDIDNKKLFLKFNKKLLGPEEEKDINDLIMLKDYIQNCIKDKYIESFFLKKFIIELKTNLDNILSKEQYYYGKNVDLFKMTLKIKETNKKIQEMFYNFNLNILMMFHYDNELSTSYDQLTNIEQKMSKELKFKGKLVSLCNDELLFCSFFRESIKYKIYYENFIQNFDSMDIFKISLLFCEEFINLKLNERNNSLSNISFFNIIDTLYFQSMPQTVNINVNILFSEYTEKLKKYFKHFYMNKNKSENQLFILNRKILNKFIYLLNNDYEDQQLNDLFPSKRLRTSDFIASIDQRSVKDVIKNYLINTKIISKNDYLLYSVVYIFAMSLTLHPYQQILTFLAEILYCFNDISMFVRYHINIILQSFHNSFLINIENQLFQEFDLNKMKIYYFYIGNYIKQKGIVPDEEMMSVLSYFFGNKMMEKRDRKITKNIEIQNTIDVTKYNNEENQNMIQDKVNNVISDNNIYLEKKEDIFNIKLKYNFHCFVKHSFNRNGILNSKFLVNYILNSPSYSKFILKLNEKQKLTPIIVIKIKEFTYSSEILYPLSILRECSMLYSDFSENFNYDLKKLDLKKFRSILVNLIFYGLEIVEIKIPVDFLIYTLYALKGVDTDKERN